MKVLVIGSGGREHALVRKLAQSEKVSQIYCAPGNDGIGRIAELVSLDISDLDSVVEWASDNDIDLTVVGPEVPLVDGIVDKFEEAGLRAFGPSAKGAQIEGSKAFAKDLMDKYSIPTAEYRVFSKPVQAKKYIEDKGAPIVIKADGLAAGKGVVVAQELETALEAVTELMENEKFGEAGEEIVVEEFLVGVEVSLLGLCDGQTVIPMTPAHDHKPAYNGGEGPNTGGMGAFSPSHLVDDELIDEIRENILEKTLFALKEEGIEYKGILYAGLMLTEDGPKVLEFNARFGDPETQVILPRLDEDLVELMEDSIAGQLSGRQLSWKEDKAQIVIMASGGYPINYEKGKEISGLNEEGQLENGEAIVFHAGTRYEDGNWYSNGGRVLGVTALARDFAAAKEKAYQAVERISFDKVHYRTDIGDKALD